MGARRSAVRRGSWSAAWHEQDQRSVSGERVLDRWRVRGDGSERVVVRAQEPVGDTL